MGEQTGNGPRGAAGFAAGTLIHTKQGLKPVEHIRPGDWVLARPAEDQPPTRRREAHEYTYRAVTRTGGADQQPLVQITYINHADSIRETLSLAADHAVWIKGQGWMAADQIKPTDVVVLSFNGNALVTAVGTSKQGARVYTLELDAYQTCHAGELGAWVSASRAGGSRTGAASAEAAKPFDFTQPRTLLRIENYYNDTLANPGQRESVSQKHIAPHAPDAQMEQVIQKLRTSYAQRQARFNELTLASLRVAAPSWMKPSDRLFEILERQTLLYAEGKIVWAALIQANNLLFSPGAADCPALLACSDDHYFDARPTELHEVAHKVFSYKGTAPADPELKALAELVTDEADRSMKFALPKVFSRKDIQMSTFMVFRKHIPNGVLNMKMFPVLIHPATAAVMIVPFEFWPIEMIMMWKQGRL